MSALPSTAVAPLIDEGFCVAKQAAIQGREPSMAAWRDWWQNMSRFNCSTIRDRARRNWCKALDLKSIVGRRHGSRGHLVPGEGPLSAAPAFWFTRPIISV